MTKPVDPGDPQRIAETISDATNSSNASGLDEPTAERIGQQISHYRIESRLGAGGMGQVYLATDVALGRQVALKVLPHSFSNVLRERLIREAWASARMQHSSIATFYEAGEANGETFIALQYVRGWTLTEEISRGPVPPQRAVSIAIHLLEALTHAHAAEILHRDIKPSNVMCDEDGHVKLLDFGLARHLHEGDESGPSDSNPLPVSPASTAAADLDDTERGHDETIAPMQELDFVDGLTQAGTVLGTIGYMAPEQVRGDVVDGRADLFAVGLVLHEMLCGKPTFGGRTGRERLRATLFGEAEPVDVGSDSSALNAILSRALQKDRDQRYRSSAEFLTDLRALDQQTADAATNSLVAVLEPECRSTGDHAEWIPTAVAEALDSRLQACGLRTVPRPAIAAARQSMVLTDQEFATHLGCRWMVSGSVSFNNEELTLQLRLTDVSTQRVEDEVERRGHVDQLMRLLAESTQHLSRRFDEDADHDLASTSSDQTPLAAYELYIRGRRELLSYGKDSFDRAEQLLNQAIRIQSDYSPALASLSQIAGMRFPFTRDPATLQSALDLARQSIDADSEFAEAWIWRGYALSQQMFVDVESGDESEAYEKYLESCDSLRGSIDRDPRSPMSTYFLAGVTHAGCRFAKNSNHREQQRREALKQYQRSLKIAPRSCWSWLGVGFVHLELGNHVEAKWCLEKAVELEPLVVPATAGVAVFQAECLRRLGELDAARDQSLKGIQAAEATDHMYRDSFRGVGLCCLGRTTLQLGDQDAARAAFRQAVLHLRGRTRARISGQLLVQALAGETRAGQGLAPYKEAVAIYRQRDGYDFGWLWWGWDEITLLELSRAARTVGRVEEADQFLESAIQFGSPEAIEEHASQR